MDILERIKEFQKERGWTNYQLAQEAAMTQSTLTNMFARKTLPSITTLTAICDAFGITLSEFFNENQTAIVLSNEELDIINSYKKLSKKNKIIVTTLLSLLNQ